MLVSSKAAQAPDISLGILGVGQQQQYLSPQSGMFNKSFFAPNQERKHKKNKKSSEQIRRHLREERPN